MISRGFIIGKLVDDLSNLAYQINTRNKLGQFDLTKICEDFVREVINITYGFNLKNLNSSRSNNPGLDLGDTEEKIAIQVTSQKSSTKVNATLEAINDEQKKSYKRIVIFILGHKQSSYSINKDLAKKCNFEDTKDIWDIDTLLKEVVILDIDKLDMIYNLFSKEFRTVKIELEPVDESGNYESSYYSMLESKPSAPPKNALKFFPEPNNKDYEEDMKTIRDIYDRLASVPRVTREILSIIVDKGEFKNDSYRILPKALERFLKIDEGELLAEINLLENYSLISIIEGFIGERGVSFIVVSDEYLNMIFNWLIDKNLSIRTLLNTMNFSVLDN